MNSHLLFIVLSLLHLQREPGHCPASDSLTVRNAHALAYDEGSSAVMLFGGADEKQVLGDLWAWNGEAWQCLSDQGPSPRTFPALAYDGATNHLVVFGGNSVLFGTPADTASFLDDMWEWDGGNWRQIDVQRPSARAEASMAYDRNRKRLVLFGGYRSENGKRVRLGDTWEWDGRSWTQMDAGGPSARNGAAMAYDTDRRRVVLFGGSGNSGDTWEWDGSHWTPIVPAQTEARFNPAMAYDRREHLLIRFGGWTPDGRVGDTWKYDGEEWSPIPTEGPVRRNHTSMAYDTERGVIVLFGGHDGDHIFGDTWEWNGHVWLQKSLMPSRPRVDNGH